MSNCIYCGKKYKNASAFRKHQTICGMLKNIKTVDVYPTMDEIYPILVNLVQDNIKLKEKIRKIENRVYLPVKKIDIVKWLNENMKCNENFDDWINDIEITESIMNSVVENGLVLGISTLLINLIQISYQKNIPIKSLTQLKKIYIYDGEWKIFTNENVKKTIFSIQRKLFNQLSVEKDKLGDKIYDNAYNGDYLKKSRKLIGGKKIDDNVSKIHAKIFKATKENANRIINNKFKLI